MDQKERISSSVLHEMGQAVVKLVPYYVLAALLVLAWWAFHPSALRRDKQLQQVASVAESLVLSSVFAGVAAMATVQFGKALFHPRSSFHAAELNKIFHGTEGQVLGLAAPKDPTHPSANGKPSYPTEIPPLQRAAEELRKIDELKERDELRILLDSPTEVLMGQIRSAADYIVLRPKGFERALRCLAGRAGEEAVKTYLNDLEEGSRAEDSTEPDVGDDDSEGGDAKHNVAEDDVAAVRFFVEQNLNRIHITLRDGWRRQVRTVAALVAGAVGFLTIFFADVGPLAKGTVVLVAVVWGGFFSWLARDVAALVERRRG